MPADAVIAWSGDVTAAAVERVRLNVDAAVRDAATRRLVFDFGAADFVEPVVLGALIRARNAADARGIPVVLQTMPTAAKRLLAMTGLTDLFTFVDPPPTPVDAGDLPDAAGMPATPDAELDEVAELVRQLLGVPTALVTLVDRQRQVFPGAVGLPQPWQDERSTPLTHSFCKYVVDRAAPLVVHDARTEPLFADSPAIDELGVVAYAGMPLTDTDGRVVGALCAIDSEPRDWSADELEALRGLAVTCSAALRMRTQAARRSPR